MKEMRILGRCPKCGYLLTEETPVCPRDGLDASGQPAVRRADGSSTADVGAQPSVGRRRGWGRYVWVVGAAGVVVIILVVVLIHRGARTGGVGSDEGKAVGGGAAAGVHPEIVGYQAGVYAQIEKGGKVREVKLTNIRGIRADGTSVDISSLPREMREEAERLLRERAVTEEDVSHATSPAPGVGGPVVAVGPVTGTVAVARPGFGGLPVSHEEAPVPRSEIAAPGAEERGHEVELPRPRPEGIEGPFRDEKTGLPVYRERIPEEEMRLPSFDVPGPPPIQIPGAKAETPGAKTDTESAKEETPGVGTPEVSGGVGEEAVRGEGSGP